MSNIQTTLTSILLTLLVLGGGIAVVGSSSAAPAMPARQSQLAEPAPADLNASAGTGLHHPNLTAHFTDDVVTNGESPIAHTDLVVESHVDNVRYTITSDAFSAEKLADIFREVTVEGGTAITMRELNKTGVIDGNFTGVEPGQYNFTLQMVGRDQSETLTLTVVKPGTRKAAITERQVKEHVGDIATFTVRLKNTDQAWVVLGTQEVNYKVRFKVNDVDDDNDDDENDTVTVKVNTFLVGQDRQPDGITAVGDDTITSFQLLTEPVDMRLQPAVYPIQTGVADRRQDVAALDLQPATFGDAELFTAPDRASVGNLSQLEGVLSADQTIARQDWAVVKLNVGGVFGYVATADDLTAEDLGLSFQVLKTLGVNRKPVAVDTVEIVPAPDANALYVLLDTNGLEIDHEYRVNFTVSEANPYLAPGETHTATANFTLVGREISFADTPVEVPAGQEVTISGSTTLAPGTNLTVEVVNLADKPFLAVDSSVVVTENGTWEATVDLSGVNPGTPFTVRVFRAGMAPEKAPGRVVEMVTPAANVTEAEAQNETTPPETETETAAGTQQNETTPTPTPTETETPAGNQTGNQSDRQARDNQPQQNGDLDRTMMIVGGLGLAVLVGGALLAMRG